MNRVQVIVVPDETSAVRRYQVPRRLIEYGPWTAVVIAVLLVAGSIDYVRLRRNAVDVGRLRQQTAQHRGELDDLAGGLASLEEEFSRLLEFERKVRVMAGISEFGHAVSNERDPAAVLKLLISTAVDLLQVR